MVLIAIHMPDVLLAKWRHRNFRLLRALDLFPCDCCCCLLLFFGFCELLIIEVFFTTSIFHGTFYH